MWYGVVRCGVVWCDVAWCGVVWCGVVWCGVVWCGVVWCGVVWCDVLWCGVVWRGVVWCVTDKVTKCSHNLLLCFSGSGANLVSSSILLFLTMFTTYLIRMVC